MEAPKHLKINNCYDSHVHWLATGSWARRLDLKSLKSEQDVKSIKSHHHFMRGDWLLGFGWDQNLWASKEFPTRQTLDEAFPGVPVYFSRADGHAFWVSTEALKRADLFHQNPTQPEGGKIVLDADGWPTGVLVDLAGFAVESLVPKYSHAEVCADLKMSAEIFHRAGFTHIRDLSCDPDQWHASVTMFEKGELNIAVEQFFGCEDPKDFSKTMDLALQARKNPPRLLRPRGIKLYYDGALGSEGAYLSAPYCTGGGKGLVLIERIALKEMMAEVWSAGFDIAVHAIGDEAAHQIASVAYELWDIGEEGRLHIEHSQMMRPETIKLLVGKPVMCHMQPCHFLSDRKWLKEKLGNLYTYVFPWRALQEAKVPIMFGSDTPIEPPSLIRNYEALEKSAHEDIPALIGDFSAYHAHLDHQWTPNTYTEYEDLKATRVVFEGKEVFQA